MIWANKIQIKWNNKVFEESAVQILAFHLYRYVESRLLACLFRMAVWRARWCSVWRLVFNERRR